MKKEIEVKYPNSVNLFQFCRRVLDHKFGGVRVIDQDVGQILGFDPADCSHWKKGKKNIRSIQAMKSIAEHLGIDEKLVVDIASGEISQGEAFFEYSGYGDFEVNAKVADSAKKEFYRKHPSSMEGIEEQPRLIFTPNMALIDELVSEVHKKINFSEAPLYIPEILAHYQQIKMTPAPKADGVPFKVTHRRVDQELQTEILFGSGLETRAYMRFQMAKAIGQHFFTEYRNAELKENDEFSKHLLDVESNIFSAKLLSPAPMLRQEMAKVNVARDILSQLSEVFWVSRVFMNQRLKDILQNQPAL